MEWYWWVLLAAVVVIGGYVKLKVLSKWMESRKRKEASIPEEE
jgi:hypothetical protein